MKAPMMRLVLPLMAALLFAGCMSTGNRKVDDKEAARLNTISGSEYLRQGNLRDAKEKLDKAVKQDPRNYKAQWVMGLLLEALEKPTEAGGYYKTAVRLQPDDPDVANTYAVYLCKSGRTDEAMPLFDKVIRNKLYREPWAAATNAAVCLRAEKRNADALTYAELAVARSPGYVDAVIQKADLQLDLGRGTQARQTVDAYLAVPKTKESDPHRPEVLLIGVRAGLAESNHQAAENYARLLRRDFPGSPQTASLPQLLPGAK